MDKLDKDGNPPSEGNRPFVRRGGPNGWLLLGLLVIIGFVVFRGTVTPRSVITDYRFFLQQIEAGNVFSVELHGTDLARGTFKTPPLESELDSSGKKREERKRLEKNFEVRLVQSKAAQDKLSELLEAHKVQTIPKPPAAENAVFFFWGVAIRDVWFPLCVNATISRADDGRRVPVGF